MGGVEKPSPIDIGAAGSSFSSDLHHWTDPDAGLSEAQKKEVVSLFSPLMRIALASALVGFSAPTSLTWTTLCLE